MLVAVLVGKHKTYYFRHFFSKFVLNVAVVMYISINKKIMNDIRKQIEKLFQVYKIEKPNK